MYQSPSPPSSPRNSSRDRVRADQSRLRGQCQVHTQVNPSRVSTSSRVSSLSRTYIMAWHHPSHSTTTPVKTANHDRGFARRILFTFVPGPVEARTEFEAGWRSKTPSRRMDQRRTECRAPGLFCLGPTLMTAYGH